MTARRNEWNEISTVGVTARDDSGNPPPGLTLHVIGADGATAHRLPGSGQVTIGRGDGVDIAVPDASISRKHAIVHLGDRPSVEDAGSANGTRVGGVRIPSGQRAPIAAGDLIELGTVMMLVHGGPPRGKSVAPKVGKIPPEEPPASSWPGEIVEDPVMKQLRRLVDRIAPSNVSVLLLGETGAGKEVLASAIHRASPRAAGPFVRLNCAAMQDALFESELFGHERGAFTGAVAAKPGLLESANGGTVFFDEVGELSLSLQAKLLRVIEERQVMRVGALKPRAIDVRIVSATNRDLEAEVEAQRFRQDLFFRFNGIPLVIPPLRERPSEILPLTRAFLTEAARQAGRAPIPALTSDAVAVLMRHPWPGNIRELKNVITRALLLATDEITPECLSISASPRSRNTAPPPGLAPLSGELSDQLKSVERQRILEVLERCGGNQSRAAKELGISRNTLLARLRAYGVRT